MFTELAFERDSRGLYRFRYISGRMPYRLAAEQILKTTGTVFLLTGFYVLRAQTLETDGITGTWVLCQILKSLGYNVIIPADSNVFNMFQSVFPDELLIPFPITDTLTARQTASGFLKKHQPDVIISVERPGPLPDGSFRNYNGDNISDFCSRMDYFWTDNCLKIAIGDGGNELGMGILHDVVSDKTLSCPIPADITLMGSTSDFSAWCLAATLETLAGQSVMPPQNDVRHLLNRLPKYGFVDGFSAKPAATVDGFSQQQMTDKYHQIQTATGTLRTANSILNSYIADCSKSHAVPVVSVTTRPTKSGNTVDLDGYVLLNTQLKTLKTLMQKAGILVAGVPDVLSDLDANNGEWLHVPELTLDLLDQPNGRLTTQIADYDQWIRRLYIHNGWSLYQTPDGALGWSDNQEWLSLPIQTPKVHPWETIVRPVSKNCLPGKKPLGVLVNAADKLRATPYLWGGRNPDGLDCSGMTQRIFYRTGILLPRNSKEQRRCGKRIPLNEMIPGDLLFATTKTNRFHHVALIVPDGVQHACLGQKSVIVESLTQFRDRYNLIGARRISSFA